MSRFFNKIENGTARLFNKIEQPAGRQITDQGQRMIYQIHIFYIQ